MRHGLPSQSLGSIRVQSLLVANHRKAFMAYYQRWQVWDAVYRNYHVTSSSGTTRTTRCRASSMPVVTQRPQSEKISVRSAGVGMRSGCISMRTWVLSSCLEGKMRNGALTGELTSLCHSRLRVAQSCWNYIARTAVDEQGMKKTNGPQVSS
jgi:hypothetical protein